MTRLISAVLASLIALPPGLLAAPLATLAGSLTSPQGSRLAGLELGLVDLDSGRVVSARSDGAGVLRAQLAPGLYAVDAGGFEIVQGPRILRASAGEAVSLALMLVPGPRALAAETGPVIDHVPIGCVVAGEPARIQAAIAPAEQVTGARVHFRSALAQTDSVVEMTRIGGRFEGRLPGIELQAKQVTYSIEASSASGSRRTQDLTATVVNAPGECGSRVAAVGPGGPAAGAAGASGTGGGLGTTALIVAGALVAGAATVIIATRGGEPAPASPSR